MAEIDRIKIRKFLAKVGERCSEGALIFLIGGGALKLLGQDRPTFDLDYVGSDIEPDNLQTLMAQIAVEMNIILEAVPIEEFVPVLIGAYKRSILIGEYGNLSVYVFDPYTVALSKLDRGFDADTEDIIFLARQKLVNLEQLAELLEATVEKAPTFDLDIEGMRMRFKYIRELS